MSYSPIHLYFAIIHLQIFACICCHGYPKYMLPDGDPLFYTCVV